jgi:hypothetical protein
MTDRVMMRGQEEAAGAAPSRPVLENSIMMAINGFPVSTLTHEQKMLRLQVNKKTTACQR